VVRRKLDFVRLVSGLLCFSVGSQTIAQAQIVPDATLGAERSQVNPNATVQGIPSVLIEGGAQRGANLFQSFIDFNVADRQRVYFANPAGVQSILTRVTGGNASNILGTLGVDGAANLFLLNPNGILFGPNAQLDIRGSFVASTANQWTLGDGQAFSASNPTSAPLITVAIRPGLQYGSAYRGDITNEGNLAVGAGQVLSLEGQTNIQTGSLIAPGGTVQVLGDRVSLLGNARIDVSGVNGGGTVLVGGDFQGGGGVPQAPQTQVDANAQINADAIGLGDGGRVIVWAKDRTQFAGNIFARGGNGGGNGGFVEVSGKQVLDFKGRVDVTAPRGSLGTVLLDPTDIEITPANVNDFIGNILGDIILQADNNITLNAPIVLTQPNQDLRATAGNNIFVNQNITTDGGAVVLTALQGGIFLDDVKIESTPDTATVSNNFIVLNANIRVEIKNSVLKSRNETAGRNDPNNNTGAIGIVAQSGSVLLDNVWLSTTSTTEGDAGLILITAADKLEILNSLNPDDNAKPPGIFSQGNGGNILIGNDGSLDGLPTPKTIRIGNSNLSTNNRSDALTTANSGNIFVSASESVLLDDKTRISTSSGLKADDFDGIPGNAGNVIVTVEGSGTITLQNNSFISSNTFKQGNAGGISLTTRGNGTILVQSDAELGTSTFGNGDAGAILLKTGSFGSITLDTGDIFSNVELGGIGNGGLVAVDTGSLVLNNGAQIQTIVRGAGPNDTKPSGQGNAGAIIVSAANSVRLLGFESKVEDGELKTFSSGLRSSVDEGASGTSGIVFVQTPLLFLKNRAAITTSNLSAGGEAGYILVDASFIVLDELSGLFSVSRSGQGGSIGLQTPYLVGVSRGSVISTRVGSDMNPGTGGDIVIGKDLFFDSANKVRSTNRFPTLFVYGFPYKNSDILADAFRGQGGRIEISSIAFRNLQERPRTGITDDLDATSGVGLNGVVNVTTLNLDPDRGLQPLPDLFQDPRLSEGCDPRTRQETSRLTQIGKGGVATNYSESLPRNIPLAATSTNPVTAVPQPSAADRTSPPDLQPAQGWAVGADGTIRLVAALTPSPLPIITHSATCPAN
jgi:filamentous hemagglutinin family protein